MLTNTDLFVMFPQQLLADGVPVFSNDPDQPVDIFSMVPHQFGEFLHLGFEMFQAPHESVLGRRGPLLGKRGRFFRQRRHEHILFHVHPLSQTLTDTMNDRT